ncbi:MAG: glycosyltransferase family 4 protein [Gemmatimonadaceae bacterium]
MREPRVARVVVVAGFADSLINFRGPLLRRLVADGHQVTACAPDATDRVRGELAALGVEYRHIPVQRARMNPVHDLNTLRALTAVYREIQPDVVLAYTIKPVIYGSIAARLARVPQVCSLITGLGYSFGTATWRQRALNPLVRLLFRFALARNRVVFFQNPDDLRQFVDAGLATEQQAVLVNGSGVDLEHFAVAPIPEGEPIFLLVTRLIWEKGVGEYVEAARQLKGRYPNARFRVLGPLDPNPAAVSRAQLETWCAEGMIEYLGSTDDVRPALAAASVFVLPSAYREGTPRSVLEAMAMGRPVITTDAPGCRETVVSGRNGFLVPINDSTALAAAMERFIRDPGLVVSMGAHSRSIAEKKYDVHLVNRVMMQAMGLNTHDA